MESRKAFLVMCSAQNNNKFYNMIQQDDKISVSYGRIDVSTQHATYPISKWNSLYKSKIRKGYKDVTDLRLIEESSIDFEAIGDNLINQFVTELQSYANRSIQANYTISSDAVTQKQVDEAQRILDQLSDYSKFSTHRFNDHLIELYQVIPRKMKRVQDHLWTGDPDHANKIVDSEQATLDVMKGQVRLSSAKRVNKIEDKKTILEAMDLDLTAANEKEIQTIKLELGEIAGRFRRAFKVNNHRTQRRFDLHVEQSKDKTCRLFWHGSRNENWWNILDSGLVLRPTNSIITGKMYGMGIYFTDKARKSYGYTSCRGAYWTRGIANKGFMSLYNVHLGRTLIKKKHEYWMYSLNEQRLKQEGDYNSLSALGGIDLINNEFIIYNEKQATIKYIVEVS